MFRIQRQNYKIMKMLLFHARSIKKNEIRKIPRQNNENYEHLNIPQQNYESY